MDFEVVLKQCKGLDLILDHCENFVSIIYSKECIYIYMCSYMAQIYSGITQMLECSTRPFCMQVSEFSFSVYAL